MPPSSAVYGRLAFIGTLVFFSRSSVGHLAKRLSALISSELLWNLKATVVYGDATIFKCALRTRVITHFW